MLAHDTVYRSLSCFFLSLQLALPQLAAAQERESKSAEATPAEAQGPDAATPDTVTFVLRTYDVSDLILQVEDRPFSDSLLKMPGSGVGGGGMMGGGGGGMGGGGGFFSVPGDEGRGAATERPFPEFIELARHENTRVGRDAVRSAQPTIRYAQHGMEMMGGPEGGMAPGGFSPGSATSSTQITLGELVHVLTTMVAGDSWLGVGGQGRIEQLGTVLVVWQSPEVHDQIEKFLQQINNTFGNRRTVTVDARWLLLSSDDLAKLMPETKDAPAPVDRKVLEEFTRRPGSIRGITNSFSGQLVYIISGTMRNVVGGWIPVVGALDRPELTDGLASLDRAARVQFVSAANAATGSGRSVGYQPIMTNLNLGALLEIRPTLIRRNEAVVDVKSTLTVSRDQAAQVAAPATEGVAPQVDRVAVETLQFATTMRMPLKTPVLVGGLTNMPSTTSEGDAVVGDETERPQLYLVLEIR